MKSFFCHLEYSFLTGLLFVHATLKWSRRTKKFMTFFNKAIPPLTGVKWHAIEENLLMRANPDSDDHSHFEEQSFAPIGEKTVRNRLT